MQQINVYFDESCHLLKDNSNVLGIGCLYCPVEYKKEIMYNIRAIKRKHNFSRDHEIKWTKVSKGKMQLYKDLIDYLFEEKNLYFRAVITLHKDRLVVSGEEEYRHWYEKMNYYLFNKIINYGYVYRLFLDKRDTKGKENLSKLEEIIKKVLKENETSVNDYKSGKQNALKFLMGMIMKEGYYIK